MSDPVIVGYMAGFCSTFTIILVLAYIRRDLGHRDPSASQAFVAAILCSLVWPISVIVIWIRLIKALK